MTCEQIYRNESSGARSKELSHDSDGSNKKKKPVNHYGLKGMASNNNS